jgi:hypothetical protein
LWLILLGMMGVSAALFAALALFIRPSLPVDGEALLPLALVSLLGASAYVAMMAAYFGRVLSSRNEMAQEVARRRASVTALDRKATELRHMRAARLASLSRLARQCRGPVDEILACCEGELEGGAASAADFESIRTAARRLGALIDEADRFGHR